MPRSNASRTTRLESVRTGCDPDRDARLLKPCSWNCLDIIFDVPGTVSPCDALGAWKGLGSGPFPPCLTHCPSMCALGYVARLTCYGMQVRGHVNSVVLANSTVPLGPVHHNDAVLHWAANREGSTALDQRRPPSGSRRNAGEGQHLVPANACLS